MPTSLTLTESARERFVGFTKNEIGPREVDQIISYCREYGDSGEEGIHVSENLVEEAYEEVIS